MTDPLQGRATTLIIVILWYKFNKIILIDLKSKSYYILYRKKLI